MNKLNIFRELKIACNSIAAIELPCVGIQILWYHPT